MFRLFRSRNKKPQPVYNEQELIKRSKTDGYRRSKLLTDVLIYTISGLIILFSIALLYQYIVDVTFRNFILDQFKESIKGIIFFILSIGGVKLINTKNS